MRKYRNFIGILAVVFMALIFFFVQKVYLNKTDVINIIQEEPAHKLDAKTVINLIQNDDENFIEPEQVVEIEGIIKKISFLNNRITILLGSDSKENAYVICDMQSDQSEEISMLKPRDSIKLKGVFKGFLEDAIFLNCVISN